MYIPIAACAAGANFDYAAILDTAADIAKAMLHLHSVDVLHGDLKVGHCWHRGGRKGGEG